MEVLALVQEGLQNVEIAQRLFLSERTVHSHVSSILRKLGVRTRGQASAEAERLGVGSPGQDTASTIGPHAVTNVEDIALSLGEPALHSTTSPRSVQARLPGLTG